MRTATARRPIQSTPWSTPWGTADCVTEVTDGIWFLSTPSHGGYYITPDRRSEMPAALREADTFAGGNWYEEDCDWSIVALAFPAVFPKDAVEAARKTLKVYRPAIYTALSYDPDYTG